eukprot:15364905-Ditylum_brightwellii.AAC.2
MSESSKWTLTMVENHPDSLQETVQHLCLDTLDHYVFKPSEDQITQDLILGLRKLKNAMRWKEFWRLKASKYKTMGKEEKKVEVNDANNISVISDESTSKKEDVDLDLEGLWMGLSQTESTKQAPCGLAYLEKFFHCIESTLLEKAREYKVPSFCSKDKKFMKLHNQLQKDKNLMVLPTNKTNSYCTVEKQGGGDPPRGCKICREVVRKFVTWGKWTLVREPGCQGNPSTTTPCQGP